MPVRCTGGMIRAKKNVIEDIRACKGPESLIDKAITDGVDPFYPRGRSNFALPLGEGKRALLARQTTLSPKKESIGIQKQGRPCQKE